MEVRYFEDAEPGDEFDDTWAPDFDQVQAYIGVEPGALQSQGRFYDPEVAKQLGFERPIVPGAMSMSVLARLVTDWMGFEGTLENIDVNFRRPVLHGDELRSVGVVTDVVEDGDAARVKLDVHLENDRGERPLQGTAVVRLPKRPG